MRVLSASVNKYFTTKKVAEEEEEEA